MLLYNLGISFFAALCLYLLQVQHRFLGTTLLLPKDKKQWTWLDKKISTNNNYVRYPAILTCFITSYTYIINSVGFYFLVVPCLLVSSCYVFIIVRSSYYSVLRGNP